MDTKTGGNAAMGLGTNSLPIEDIREICGRYGVRELAVFGSAARGTASPGSDVDLLVEFAPDARVGFMAFSRMQRELSALLGRPVDLVPKRGLCPTIAESVLAEAEVLYAS
jgi:predicted nucleotidyltransferase